MGIVSGKCLLLPGDEISPNKLTMPPSLNEDTFVDQQYHRSELVSITWISLPSWRL